MKSFLESVEVDVFVTLCTLIWAYTILNLHISNVVKG